jgi:hypothetical protein
MIVRKRNYIVIADDSDLFVVLEPGFFVPLSLLVVLPSLRSFLPFFVPLNTQSTIEICRCSAGFHFSMFNKMRLFNVECTQSL